MRVITPSRSLRFLALVASILVCVATVCSQSGRVTGTPTPTPDDTERVLTEEVKLNVLAFDENGKFVPDVTAQSPPAPVGEAARGD